MWCRLDQSSTIVNPILPISAIHPLGGRPEPPGRGVVAAAPANAADCVNLPPELGRRFPTPTQAATPRVRVMRRIEFLPETNRHKRPLWAEFIFTLDSWLQRW